MLISTNGSWEYFTFKRDLVSNEFELVVVLGENRGDHCPYQVFRDLTVENKDRGARNK